MARTVRPTGLIQLPDLADQHGRRLVYAVFASLAGALAIGAVTATAYWTRHPLVVPSLGPTAFLVFNRSQSSAARPRNIVCGHLVGAVCGFLGLVAFGLVHAPSVVAGGLTPGRIGAAAFSIATTSALMILLRVEHGPAGATTLIVSLGFMTTPASLGLLMGGVVFLALLGLLFDRLVGLPLPYWSGGHPAGAGARREAPHPAAGRAHTNGHGGPVRPGRRLLARADGRIPAWMVPPHQGRRVLVGTEECVVKVQDAEAHGPYSLLEVELDPHRPLTMLHAHYGFDETYFVIDGAVVAEVGNERQRAAAGATIVVPAGVPHLLNASGHDTAHCLCITDHSRSTEPEYLP